MTFTLYKNSANTVYLTLTEKATISATSINFLFNLKDEQGKTEYNFIAQNISTATSRYDRFLITETGSTYQVLTGGTVTLGNNYCWYTYNVFEQNSNTNLDPASAGNLLETGYCFLSGSTNQVSIKKHSSGEINIKAHN